MTSNFKTSFKEALVEKPEQCLETLHFLFSEYARIPMWHKDALDILEAVLSSKAKWIMSSPAAHLQITGLWIRLMHCAAYIHDRQELIKIGIPNWDDIIRPTLPKTGKPVKDLTDYLPKWLDEREISFPLAVLTEFFSRKPLKKWLKEWNIWREISLSNHSLIEEKAAEAILKDFVLYCKMLDACYVIYIQHISHEEICPS